MSPPAWAYQVDSFDPPPDEELVCSVCHCVFCDPVYSPCNHVFCRTCISKWLERNRNCPICRKRSSLYSIQDVVPLIRNMINKLTLRCHNLEKGCVEKFTLEACETHLKSCLYELIKCKNKPCKQMVLRKDMNDHELYDCSHRYVKCKKCGLKISLMVPKEHDCLRELKQCLQEKMQIIKKKKLKIKELQNEIKTLKDNGSQHSSTDSVDSIGAAAVMMNLNDLSSLSSSSSSINISSDSLVSNSENGDSMSMWDQHQTIQDIFDAVNSDLDQSTEQARAASPYPVATRTVHHSPSSEATLDVLTEDFSPVRRPAKRRLPAILLDSSDEDEENRELPSLPSPKRIWRVQRDFGGETSQGMYASPTSERVSGSASYDGAGPSSARTTAYSDTPELPPLRMRFRKARLGPLMTPSPQEEPPASTSRSNGGFLESTIAMLSTSNLESDPEWLPNAQPTDQPEIEPNYSYTVSSVSSVSSDSSSSSDSDSDSGSEGPDLLSLNRISRYSCSDDDDDDPDFRPIEDF